MVVLQTYASRMNVQGLANDRNSLAFRSEPR